MLDAERILPYSKGWREFKNRKHIGRPTRVPKTSKEACLVVPKKSLEAYKPDFKVPERVTSTTNKRDNCLISGTAGLIDCTLVIRLSNIPTVLLLQRFARAEL